MEEKFLKVAIIGTVGVPARYGGFETLAEQLTRGIKPEVRQLVVYCQRSAYPDIKAGEGFAGHRRVLLPLRANGLASMFYDMLAILHAALIAKVDVLLVLGYSGAWVFPFVRLIRPALRIVTNIDGMEWRRNKFGFAARILLRGLEWFAARFSHQIIADNAVLVDLASKLHHIEPRLIAYGGDHTLPITRTAIPTMQDYYLSIARIEPENNCHLILEACAAANVRLIFIGNWAANSYGRTLKERYASSHSLTLMDSIYDLSKLAIIRAAAIGYIHGHSVGGTNPSLVEAIFHTNKVLAFDCPFNRSTLADAGAYFANAGDLINLLQHHHAGQIDPQVLTKLREHYRWSHIVDAYLDVC